MNQKCTARIQCGNIISLAMDKQTAITLLHLLAQQLDTPAEKQEVTLAIGCTQSVEVE